MPKWTNWSGSVVANPHSVRHPTSEEELAQIVQESRQVRVVGAGHSFTPLCETEGALISLDQMEGQINLALDRTSAWIPAGQSIGEIGAKLWPLGLSLINQGDIDHQALAGALSTGTHGTGRKLGSLSTFAKGYRLVLADGSIGECDPEHYPDIFQAQRLGLGALGIVSKVKLAVAPRYRLREHLMRAPLGQVLEEWDALADGHRHVEFFIFPYTDTALLKTLDIVEEGDDQPTPNLDAGVMQLACSLARWVPPLAPTLQRLLTGGMTESVRAGPAWKIFPSERPTRFEEMEYEIPAANGAAALRAAIAQVRKSGLPIIFPFEYRVVAGDDIWLSPQNGGECVSISFHQYAKMPWRKAFDLIEPVLAGHGGRPHWAKRHSLNADDVLRLYPKAREWGEVRRRVDGEGKFLNPHLRELFAFSLGDAPQ